MTGLCSVCRRAFEGAQCAQHVVLSVDGVCRGEELARGLFAQYIALLPDEQQVGGVALAMGKLQELKLDAAALGVAWKVVGKVAGKLFLDDGNSVSRGVGSGVIMWHD